MKYLLPALALLWLGMIYAGEFFGAEYHPAAQFARRSDGNQLVVSADPSLTQLGLKPGVVVDVNRMSLGTRLRFMYGVRRGMSIALPVIVAGHSQTIVVPVARQSRTLRLWQTLFDVLVATFSLLLAAYLGFRKPGLMIVALIMFLGGGILSWPAFAVLLSGWPDALYTPITSLLQDLCDWFPVLVLAAFAVRFPRDDFDRSKMIAVRIIDVIVAIGFVLGLLPYFQTGAGSDLAVALSGVFIFAACIVSLRHARADDRARVGIVFAAMLIGGVGYAINLIVFRHTGNFVLFVLYANASIVLVPLAVAYSILRHRVFDITFVLNRTIVYALTSALVLVALAAMEFAAERYLNELTRVEGIALQFIIALGVIVGARLVHNRVDRFVDSVLFRARHQQETALRRFATTVQFFTAQTPLIRDTVQALERFGRVQGAAVYLASGRNFDCVESTYSSVAERIDENDLALVELRAHREALQISGVRTAFAGERLYPMYLSGRLIGALSVGQRENGEQMPPDIDEAIERVASAIAGALTAIETDRIREEKALLEARISGALS